ncbi:MAG TPA: peptidoglycan-associated lipoprotein Pal [Nitrospirae bacterium]|nr:outer membrane lipoprotein Omp16 precursor [bacterium BMS3Abin10]GBE38296.1 outer membrane lipoprotein Omp16 precursor [bacterium BMS3Bbin08]HDH50977.1 peptidoglycan-associated lipoprotein Pal [Nitrospirota bacterium]HDK16789.1 peptidoglycan-associated lipoprotein Pal [Nitrospirota bacterium]HDK41610.1 peptidoglycan-associated lipoprotein Pal [Nitrospirota bacterium]
MKKFLILVLVAGLTIFAFGCAKKHVKPTDEAGAAREEVVEETLTPREAGDVSTYEEESLFEFKDALFEFNKYNIRPDTRAVLDSVASWLNDHRDINVLIEGHCDERGTNEYNLALGEKRAKAARDYLISRGVSSKRMSTITYGEEKPVCSSHNENCWQRNRRAHFVVTR